MCARCLVQTQILLLPINISCYSTQLLTLDYYTRSTPQLYPVSASSSWPVNEITSFFRRHCASVSMSQGTDLSTQWEFKTPEGGLQ